MPQYSITTGLELEMIQPAPAAGRIFEAENFGQRTDSSLLDATGRKLPTHGPGAGVEWVTPVYTVDVNIDHNNGYSANLANLNQRIAALTAGAQQVNSSCGLHVHLGRPNGDHSNWNPRRLHGGPSSPASEWKPAHVRTWLALGLILEDRVFEVVPESRKQRRHCRRIREAYSAADIGSYHVVKNLKPRKFDNPQRYCWLNLIETARPASPSESRIGYAASTAFGTVEIRALGETKDPLYIQAWAALWLKVATAIAYLPGESAILRCGFTPWLDPEFNVLRSCKHVHETSVAPVIRSVLPPTPAVAAATTEEEN